MLMVKTEKGKSVRLDKDVIVAQTTLKSGI